MPRRLAVLACTFLATLAAGCSGGDGSTTTDEVLLGESSFKEAVAAELTQAGLDAEQGFGAKVSVSEGPNRVDIALDEQLAEYQADPERKDEILAGVVATANERLDAGISDVSLEEASADLMPLLQAPFDVRQYGFEPAATEFPGNLDVVYVVDGEEGRTVVRPEDVERWGTTVEELHETAVANLLRRTNEDEPLVCEPAGNGLELCGWASGDGYDATRMIVPGLRRQIVREYGEPAVYAVPLDNVFIALPRRLLGRGATERLLRTKVQRDFQTGDYPMSTDLFVERDGELAVLK